MDQIRGTAFDPESIMLYFFPGRWTKSGIGTRSNEVLSNLDKMFIASRELILAGERLRRSSSRSMAGPSRPISASPARRICSSSR